MANKDRESDDRDSALRRADNVLATKASRSSLPAAEYRVLLGQYRKLLGKFRKVMLISDSYSAELKKTTEQLEQVRSLTLPICMFCKKIRVDNTYWEQVDSYFAKHIDVAFTHGICPECLEEKYGDLLSAPQTRERIASEVRFIAKPPAGQKIPDTDAAVLAAENLISSPEPDAERVRAGLRKLADNYRRLLRRMGKILLISDGYQARLMDLNTRLNLLAHTDGLTGLSNRQDAMEKLEVERSRAERHGGRFSVVIVDLDDFKLVNDTHGHEAGDRLLSQLGRVFRSTMRREDTCARWGGEEFLFLLPETSGPSAEVLVGKLLTAVRRLEVPYQGETLRCTLSAGYASFVPGRPVKELLRRADAALYEAKRLGKDRVVGPSAEE
jgi:diguanylate cyclase